MEMEKQSQPLLPSLDNDDILLNEILPRLPVKSLFRFKSVCKKWRRFISNDSAFFKYHYQCHKASSSAILNKHLFSKNLKFISINEAEPNLVGVPDPSLSYLRLPRQIFTLLCSSSGLLCGNFPLYHPKVDESRGSKFYVCNPVTQDFVYITKPNYRLLGGLAFDPSSSSSSSQFELICPYRTDGSYCLTNNGDIPWQIGFDVFSSKTSVWRVSKAKLVLSNVHLRFSPLSIFTGGKLYWRVMEDIVCFDPSEDHAYLVFSPPGGEKKKNPRVEIGKCNGTGELSYTRITNTDIEIWVMREGGDSNGRFQFQWTKRYCVNWWGIFKHNRKVIPSFCHIINLRSGEASDILDRPPWTKPLPFEGGEILCFWVLGRGTGEKGNVFKYNLRSKELKVVCKSNSGNWFHYKSSLVPVPELRDFYVKS